MSDNQNTTSDSCPACGGTGRVRKSSEVGPGMHVNTFSYVPCPECGTRKWEAYPVHHHSTPVACLDEASARATAAALSSAVFPWRARPIGGTS